MDVGQQGVVFRWWLGGLGGLRSFSSEEDCNDRSDGIDNRNESVAGIVKKLWFFLKK